MKQAPTPILFHDNDNRSAAAKRTDEGVPVHSFTGLVRRPGHPLRHHI
jgi:hypothetical protein